MTVAEPALLIACADHRVVEVAFVPGRLIADIIVNHRQHHLHQLVRRLATRCSSQ